MSKLLEGKLADAIEQFLAADMADLAAVFLDDEFLGEIERFADKGVGLAGLDRFARDDALGQRVRLR